MSKYRVLLALVLTSLQVDAATAQNLPEHITIATEGAYAPWNYTKPDGSLSGYDVELAKALCERMKIKCDIVSQEWKGIIPGLTLGKYDAIVAAMGVTEERKKVVSFSIPYAKSPNGFLTTKDSALKDLPDAGKNFDLSSAPKESLEAITAVKSKLVGKIIGVQTGATAGYFVKENFKGFDIREYPTFDQLGLELASGRIDIAVASVTAFKASMDAHPDGNYVLTGPNFKGGILGQGTTNVALRLSDDSLRDAFNAAIESVNKDGTNKALAEKWFGVNISSAE